MTNKKEVSNMVKTKQLNTKDLSGLVYVVYNPAFYNLVKVGETSFNEFEKRGLNNTSVPEDFEVLALFDCVDRKAVEAAAHKAFNNYRHRASSGRLTEFFFADKANDIITSFKEGNFDANNGSELSVADFIADEKAVVEENIEYEELKKDICVHVLFRGLIQQ